MMKQSDYGDEIDVGMFGVHKMMSKVRFLLLYIYKMIIKKLKLTWP